MQSLYHWPSAFRRDPICRLWSLLTALDHFALHSYGAQSCFISCHADVDYFIVSLCFNLYLLSTVIISLSLFSFSYDTHTFPSICLIWKPAVVASCWGAHGSGEIVLVFVKQCKSVLCGYGAVQMYSSNANCAMRRLFVSLCEYISRIKRLLQQKVQSMRSAGNDAGTDWDSNEFLVLLTKWCRRGDRQSYCGKMFVAFPSLSHC